MDSEGDTVYMDKWSLSTEEQYLWVTFKNSTDQNALSFEISPPLTALTETFRVKFELKDNNLYTRTM